MQWNLDAVLPLAEMSYELDPLDVLVLTVSLCAVELCLCVVDWNSSLPSMNSIFFVAGS